MSNLQLFADFLQEPKHQNANGGGFSAMQLQLIILTTMIYSFARFTIPHFTADLGRTRRVFYS